MPNMSLIKTVKVGANVKSVELDRDTCGTDKRVSMPRGGYRFGTSNPALRPEVPEGE